MKIVVAIFHLSISYFSHCFHLSAIYLPILSSSLLLSHETRHDETRLWNSEYRGHRSACVFAEPGRRQRCSVPSSDPRDLATVFGLHCYILIDRFSRAGAQTTCSH